MLFVPRSVTTSVRPSGLNAICAGSASGGQQLLRALERLEPAVRCEKPAIPGEPLFST